jgi:hypothetical protein
MGLRAFRLILQKGNAGMSLRLFRRPCPCLPLYAAANPSVSIENIGAAVGSNRFAY